MPPQDNALLAGGGPSTAADDMIVESQTIVGNATAKSQAIKVGNAATESQTVKHPTSATQSNIAQDQPLTPTLLASFLSIPVPPNDVYTQPHPLTTPTKEAAREPVITHLQPATIDPSLLIPPVPGAIQTAGTHTSGGVAFPGPTTLPIPSGDDPALRLPTNGQEPMWMKKKGTLGYFRSVFNVGGLSTLLTNWYRLEEALGFREQVGCICIHNSTIYSHPADQKGLSDEEPSESGLRLHQEWSQLQVRLRTQTYLPRARDFRVVGGDQQCSACWLWRNHQHLHVGCVDDVVGYSPQGPARFRTH